MASNDGNAAEVLVGTWASASPDTVAAVCGEERITFRALDQASNRAGWALRAGGCRSGDRVIIALPDSFDGLVALLGALKIGAVVAPVGADASPLDVQRYTTDIGPAGVITSATAVADVVASMTAPERLVVIGAGDRPPRLDWERLVADASVEPPPPGARGGDPALLAFTSGTTGRQKVAIHTHSNIVNGSRAVGQKMFGLGPDDVVLSASRLSFSFGFGFGLCLPLAAGASTILDPGRLHLERCAELITRESPSVLCATPSFLAALLRATQSWLKADLSSLRFVISAGEPLPVQLYDAYREHFGLEVLDGIGSTEMFSHFIGNQPGTSRRGSCGVAAPDCEVQLVDEAGREVGSGEIGSLRVRSARAFVGYLNRPDTATPCDEWVMTGDRLSRDADGYFYFHGRDDDMLKVLGQWVSPHEVEVVLTAHADVHHAAVTVREDHRHIRRLVAYVVPRPGISLTPMALLQHAGARLPVHMIPSVFVVLSDLPVTPNGKVDRAALPSPEWS